MPWVHEGKNWRILILLEGSLLFCPRHMMSTMYHVPPGAIPSHWFDVSLVFSPLHTFLLGLLFYIIVFMPLVYAADYKKKRKTWSESEYPL